MTDEFGTMFAYSVGKNTIRYEEISLQGKPEDLHCCD